VLLSSAAVVALASRKDDNDDDDDDYVESEVANCDQCKGVCYFGPRDSILSHSTAVRVQPYNISCEMFFLAPPYPP
jgi:hypothetical protein